MTIRTDSEKVRALLDKAGLSQRQAARMLGVNERTMRRYCSPTEVDAPKVVIMALEGLAGANNNNA